jgi:hypothetical protein
MVTVQEIMGYTPCSGYPLQVVEELWAGRQSLTPREIAELEIHHNDRVWALCQCLAHRDRSAVVRFAQGCAERASASTWTASQVSAARAARAAADAAWRSHSAARAAYWASEASEASAAASAASDDTAAWAAWAYVAERQLQLDELVKALEVFK